METGSAETQVRVHDFQKAREGVGAYTASAPRRGEREVSVLQELALPPPPLPRVVVGLPPTPPRLLQAHSSPWDLKGRTATSGASVWVRDPVCGSQGLSRKETRYDHPGPGPGPLLWHRGVTKSVFGARSRRGRRGSRKKGAGSLGEVRGQRKDPPNQA